MVNSIKMIFKKCFMAFVLAVYLVKFLVMTVFVKRKVYILNTPIHGNLGDQAILLAEEKIIKDVLGAEYKIIRVPNMICLKCSGMLGFFIKNHSVCLHGGGFLGDLWPKEDNAIRKIVSKLNSNETIFFPQTLCSDDMKEYFKKAKPIFEKNMGLCFFARDLTSYEELKKNLKNNVFYSPDIVLYNNRKKYHKENVVTICFRNDIEKTISNDTKKQIIESVDNKYDFRIVDTVINKMVLSYNRKIRVDSILESIGKSKLLITDRLHGMIFAYLTMTPCLVFNSKSPKVKGVYRWLKKSDYIVFHNEAKDVGLEIDEMLKRKYSFNASVSDDDFADLKERILKMAQAE